MKSKTSLWFETKVRLDKTQEDGRQKKATEQYVVEAMSFTEAEAKIISEIKRYASGDFDVRNITPTSYNEIFFSENEQGRQVVQGKTSSLSPSTRRRRRRSTRPSTTLFKAAPPRVRKRILMRLWATR